MSDSESEDIQSLWPGIKYFDHQTYAIREFLLKLEMKGEVCPPYGSNRFPKRVKGGLLCDEMGAGKTIMMLALVLMNPLDSTLIMVPKAVIHNWTVNAVRANFRVFNIVGTGGEAKWQQVNKGLTRTSGVYICGYPSLIYKTHLFNKDIHRWNRVIFDEAHVFRNYRTALYKAVQKLVVGVVHRWAVTATPIVNCESDAVSLLSIVGLPVTENRAWNREYYEPLLPKFVLHRSMDELREVVMSMPPLPEIETMELGFTCDQEEDYYGMLQGIAKRMREAFAAGKRAEGLELLLRLRQAGLSPELIPSELVDKVTGVWEAGKPSAKMGAILKRVQEEPEEKFLVFCWFHREMDLIIGMLEKNGITSEQYHGGLGDKDRREVLERAIKPGCRVLLIQLQSGGVGLNLQEFSRVIFTSPYWTSALMDQAIGRAVRIGQKRIVKVYHLLLVTELGLNIDTMSANIAEAKREIGEYFFEAAN